MLDPASSHLRGEAMSGKDRCINIVGSYAVGQDWLARATLAPRSSEIGRGQHWLTFSK
jgi:hypothetical protein